MLIVNNHSLLVAEVVLCKKSLVPRHKMSLVRLCKVRSLLVAEVAVCKKSLVPRYKKLLVTRCKTRSLLVAEVACCKNSLVTVTNSLVTRCRSCSL